MFVNRTISFDFSAALQILFFVVFVSIFLSIIPFGDEPDFTVQAPKLQSGGELNFLVPLFINFNFESIEGGECIVDAGAFSLWPSISGQGCQQAWQIISARLALVIWFFLPAFIFIVFSTGRESNYHKNMRRAVALSLTFTGVIYYAEVFSHEALILSLSLCLFIAPRWLAIIIFCGIIYIDFGNGIVVGFFFLYRYFLSNLSVRYSAIISVSLILLCFFIGVRWLLWMSSLPIIGDKSAAMYDLLIIEGLADKYPVILRPVITFMSAIFMTPSGIKVIAAYIYVSFVIIYIWLKARKQNFRREKKMGDSFSAAIATILILVSIAPNYAFAKYYIFMVPVFLAVALRYISWIKASILMVVLNIIIIFNLLLYYL